MKKQAKMSKMEKVMHEFKIGKLNIGRSKKFVKNRRQAIAIGLKMSGQSKKGWKKYI